MPPPTPTPPPSGWTVRRRGPVTGALGVLAVLALAAAGSGQDSAAPSSRPSDTRDGVARERAAALLDALADRAGAARTAFTDPERRAWAFGPVKREGVSMDGIGRAADEALTALLDTALSDAGLRALAQIRDLEDVLFELESRPDRPATHRDRDLYWVRIYGDPAAEGRPWGWRYEGHHFALHVTYDSRGVAKVTPFFLGASPLPDGDGDARVDAFGRIATLHGEARAALADVEGALLADDWKPGDIHMRPGTDTLPEPAGARLGALDDEALATVSALLDAVQELLDEEHRTFDLAAALEDASDAGELTFASCGTADPSRHRAFRIRTETFALELTTTSPATHVHLVLRDVEGDFGGDEESLDGDR